MTLRVDKIVTGEGQEPRYSISIEHNGHDAEVEVSAVQIIRRFPELIEEINIKQSIQNDARSRLMVPPHGKG